MAKVDGDNTQLGAGLAVDPDTKDLMIEAGYLTDGIPHSETIAYNAVSADNYLVLAYPPTNPLTVSLTVIETNGTVSPPQYPTAQFRIVRNGVAGPFQRLVWDSDLTPGGTEIPDPSDSAPSEGLQDYLSAGKSLFIEYLR